MTVKLTLIIVLAFCENVWTYSIFDKLDQTIGPVHFANIAIRHGEREAIEGFSHILLSNEAYSPEGKENLNQSGMRHLFKVGSWLRERYDHLIPKTGIFDPKLVSVISGSHVMFSTSARSLMAGMFPPNADDIWGPASFVPVPIRTANKYTDTLISSRYPSCKKWVNEYERVQKTKEFQTFIGQYNWVFDESMRVYNSTFNATDPTDLAHEIISSVPFSSTPTIPLSAEERAFLEILEEPDMAGSKAKSFTNTLRRFVSGPLLKKMMNAMKEVAAVERLPKKRFEVYSGNSKMLSSLLFGMGIENALEIPPIFGAAILMELRVTSNNTAYVTAVYQNSYNLNDEPELLNLPLCPNPCRLDTLTEAFKPFLPDDWEKECSED